MLLLLLLHMPRCQTHPAHRLLLRNKVIGLDPQLPLPMWKTRMNNTKRMHKKARAREDFELLTLGLLVRSGRCSGGLLIGLVVRRRTDRQVTGSGCGVVQSLHIHTKTTVRHAAGGSEERVEGSYLFHLDVCQRVLVVGLR
jgi:hypothetical protein